MPENQPLIARHSLLSLAVLPIIKGALVGLQWALLMHGFDPNAEEDTYEPFDEGTGRS